MRKPHRAVGGLLVHQRILPSLSGALLRMPRIRSWRIPVGACILLVILVLAVFADLLAPYSPTRPDFKAVLEGPSVRYWLGTDNIGRDVFSRIVYGCRVTFQVATVAVGISSLGGMILGLISGYFGRWVDMVLMRIVEVVLAFPSMVLILSIAAALGPGVVQVMIAIGVVYSPYMARVIRSEVLRVREMEYVTSARAIGAGDLRIILRHVAPNVTAAALVMSSVLLANAVLAEAGISYLGLGVPPPEPSWGVMTLEAQPYLATAPWALFAPGAFIVLTVVGFNILGDGLRDALDPRLRD